MTAITTPSARTLFLLSAVTLPSCEKQARRPYLSSSGRRMFRRQLQALRYPQADSFNIKDESQYRLLVVWLELTRIRQLPEQQRAQLKAVTAPDWNDALQSYLSSLSCPLSASSASPEAVLGYLLRQAVSVEYGDDSERYNAAAATAAQRSPTPTQSEDAKRREQRRMETDQQAADSIKRVDCGDEKETRAAAKAVSAQLQLPDPDCLPQPPSTASLLQSLYALLACRIALPASAPTAASSAAASASAVSFLSSLPVGADSGDPAVNVALAALRLLSVWELKAVQESMTARLHAAQQEVKRGGRGQQPQQQLVDMQRGQVGR